ncbi:MAG: hypothetical protein KKD01_07730 [Proteobacteria bacterium]|nr:hypothetical protein [Pseudomonadota bacterium]MBU1420690.1 hypothetical protein [Pseudomonadota bacterium]MBU1454607.1 hypothetical protein [Pseudomonadota bacterium]
MSTAGNILRLKPGASRSAHLLVSASIWTVVGIMLMLRGGVWLASVGSLWLLFPAFILGMGKSLLILDNSAKKSIYRIVRFQDGRCLGAVYSVKTWLLVLLMMTAGCLLRNSSLPKEFLGVFYVTVGWGLFFSSRHAWRTWWRGADYFPDTTTDNNGS